MFVEVDVAVGVCVGVAVPGIPVVGVCVGVAVPGIPLVGVTDAVGVGVGVAQKYVVTGELRLVVVLSPNCPWSFCPQHCTVHESIHAQVCVTPVETSSAPVIEATDTGERRPVFVASPTCP